ncbi:MAG: hypothetical protein MUE40_03155 [Anaerolineae bacterium]|jgi:hypothetical protein|nr:hypothetical protein [Anaerolineae bacterium]
MAAGPGAITGAARSSYNSSSAPLQQHPLAGLYRAIDAEVRSWPGELHLYPQAGSAAAGWPGTAGRGPGPGPVAALVYRRSYARSAAIERLMGREPAGSAAGPPPHPALEIRTTPLSFAIEFIVPVSAWWDAENLAGKWSLPRCRQQFYHLLAGLPAAGCIGFWAGVEQQGLHWPLAARRATRHLDDWLSTYAPGSEAFRAGQWYPADDPALTAADFPARVLHTLRALHRLYWFATWTSDNHFRDFYRRPAPGPDDV